MSDFFTPSDTDQGIFAIRGNLDGEEKEDYIEEGEQFIGLKVENKTFLLDISLVNEIVMLSPITYVPQSPKYVDGVLNLRGIILPALNMRKMLGAPRGEVTPTTRVIIIKQDGMMVGLLIDEVTTVISLRPHEIETKSFPPSGNGIDLISRVCRKGSDIFGILDVGKIIASGKFGMKPDEDASGDERNTA